MKKIALITDGWERYVTYTWIQGYRNYMAAHQSDMDLYIFQSFGNFSMDEKHNAGEYNIARLPDFSEFDGILLDHDCRACDFPALRRRHRPVSGCCNQHRRRCLRQGA